MFIYARNLALIGSTAIVVYIVLNEVGLNWVVLTVTFFLALPALAVIQAIPRLVVSRNPEKCYVQNAWYTTSGARPDEDEVAQLRDREYAVLQEDLQIMRMVAKGLESAAVDDGGVLSPAWESCIAAFYGEMVGAMVD